MTEQDFLLCASSDPLLCHKFELDDINLGYQYSPSNLVNSLYPGADLLSRNCPSSSSPNSPDSLSPSPNLFHTEQRFIKKEELFIQCEPAGINQTLFVDDLSSPDYCASLSNSDLDVDFEERYEDFLQLARENPALLSCDFYNVNVKMEKEEPVKEDGTSNRRTPRKTTRMRKVLKNSPSTSPSSRYNGLPSADAASESSSMNMAESSYSSSSRSVSSASGDEISPPSGKQNRAGSKQRSSPYGSQSYLRRREKNNIAVRKSREKKREEIKRFATEHEKLKREVDEIRAENSRLSSLVTQLEEGLTDDKSKEELLALVASVRGQLPHNFHA